jgi:hypothetical protein
MSAVLARTDESGPRVPNVRCNDADRRRDEVLGMSHTGNIPADVISAHVRNSLPDMCR